MGYAMRNTTEAALILLIMATASPAIARNEHDLHGLHGHPMHDRAGSSATDHRHADDTSTKAAAEEEDRLLDDKVKSICRGC
jgi:hypothetical protein